MDFFLVNINSGQPKNLSHNTLNNAEFPVSNRPNRPQKKEDLRDYYQRTVGMPPSLRFANFHFLLLLAKSFDIEKVVLVAQCIQKQQELPKDLEQSVVEFVNRK